MFSKSTEVAGLVAIAIAIAFWTRWEAGLLFAGLSLLFVGASLDDVALSAGLRRGLGWVRYAWYRQMLRENGVTPPEVRGAGLPEGWIACQCGGQEECPVCDGTGAVPDPQIHVSRRSPHPPLRVDPDVETYSTNQAESRMKRARKRNGNYERLA